MNTWQTKGGRTCYALPEDALSIPALANSRYESLSFSESDKGYREIGGDAGDLWHEGYSLDTANGVSILYKPVLVTGYNDLTEDEVINMAQDILAFAFDAIGAECIEHS